MYKAEAAGLAGPVAPPVGETLLAQSLTGDIHPLFPLGPGLRWVIGVKEQFLAQWASPGLHLQKMQAGLVQGRGNSSTPTVRPVLGKSGIVRRRPALDHPVADDAWLQSVLDLSPIRAVLVLLPLGVAGVIVCAAVGALGHGWRPRLLIGGGCF